MSSAPNGRYQSRLFNFLNKQSQRLTDQYDRTIRHIKVAAVWGAQILLYPVYMMVQAGLSAGRQLSQSAAAGWPQIKALTNPQPSEIPSVDTPIERILAEVNRLPLTLTPSPEINALCGSNTNLELEKAETSLIIASPQAIISQTPTEILAATATDLNTTTQTSALIQGVATIIETRALVFVTIANQLLDILTPQQQKKLAAKITWELADQRRQWRLAASSAHRFKAQPRFAALEEKPRVLPPVRRFWHLMAWVQTSPVARAANLFQESGLIVSNTDIPTQLNQEHSLDESEILLYLAQTPAIVFLDRTFAELESHQLVPGTEVVVAISERTTRSLKASTEKLIQQLQTKFGKLDRSANLDSKSNPSGIQSLIYAAVDYFFGKHRAKLSESNTEQLTINGNQQESLHQLSGNDSTSLPSGKQLSGLKFADNTEPDPWLNWDDLYGSQTPNQGKSTTANRRNKPYNQLPEAYNSKTPVKPGNSIFSVIKRYLGFKTAPGKLSAPTRINEPNIEPAPLVIQPSAKLKTRPQQKSKSPTKRQSSAPNAVKPRTKKALSASKSASAITTPSTKSDLESTPDWIETPATPSGYVKHPLEQLLEWLDSAMLWVEELFVKMWRALRGR
jgi:hypothetical protein